MLWQPLNLSETCFPQDNTPACSSFGFLYLNLLVSLFGNSTDRKIQDQLHNGTSYKPCNVQSNHSESDCSQDPGTEQYPGEYDFIVVGAGTAGCVLANRLTQLTQWKVLLVEAGGEQPEVSRVPGLLPVVTGSSVDWAHPVQPDPSSARVAAGSVWPSGKMMGGTSSLNGLVYMRGNRADYDGWAALGNTGWAYRDVLPYFKKSENNLCIRSMEREYHGESGDQPISYFPYYDLPSRILVQAFNETGLPLTDFNGASQVGTAIAQVTSQNGKRVSTNDAFIQPIRYTRNNLFVKTNAEVVKILIDSKNLAYGIRYVKNKIMYTALAKKEVIVSCGTINSAKLLMLSGIGPKKHLNNSNITVVRDSPVGKNLQDHIQCYGIVLAFSNKTAPTVNQTTMIKEIIDYAKSDIKHGPLTGTGPISSIAYLKTDPKLLAPDLAFQAVPVMWRDYVADPQGYFSNRIFPMSFYDGVVIRPMNLAPQSKGELLLNSTNPSGSPVIYFKHLVSDKDLEILLKGVKYTVSLGNTKIFNSTGTEIVTRSLAPCEHLKWGTDQYFRCTIRSSTMTVYHSVGSCKMGPQHDAGAVVDARLRVRGVRGLRVADASMMPAVPRANSLAATLMVAEKGADFVKEDWYPNRRHKKISK